MRMPSLSGRSFSAVAGLWLSQLGDPKACNLFQIADVDSGVIRWVNADLVTHILPAI